MYNRMWYEFSRPNIWSNIDPSKVKQRIDTITAQLEGVRHQFEPEIKVGNSSAQKKS
jgi:hypothetical protein